MATVFEKMMRKSKQEKITIMIVSLIFIILSVYIISLPTRKPINKRMSTPEANELIENGIPREAILSYGKKNIGELKTDSYTAVHCNKSKWKIYLNSKETLGGKWHGRKPVFTILGHNEDSINRRDCFGTFNFESKTNRKGWISISSNAELKAAKPYLIVELPAPNKECLHEKIKARASIEFVYPKRTEAYKYTEYTTHIHRDIQFFIVSESELTNLKNLFPNNSIPLEAKIILLIGILFIFGTFTYFNLFSADQKE